VASLIAKSATEGLLPLSAGGLTLEAAPEVQITSVAPYPGREGEAADALAVASLGWPGPGEVIAKGAAAIVWSARNQAFLIGAPVPAALKAVAQLTDQSDGWTGLRLVGTGGDAALARLVAVDLSPAALPPGTSIRTGLGHMAALFHREAADVIVIHVFRSMVRTAVHEIEVAMWGMAARASV